MRKCIIVVDPSSTNENIYSVSEIIQTPSLIYYTFVLYFSAVVTSFVAFSLVMLLVLVSFIAGAPLQKLICRPLSDPSQPEFQMVRSFPCHCCL